MADQLSIVGTIILMMVVDFKRMAVEFKRFFALDSAQSFPALSIAENKLFEADERFEFNIIADNDWSHTDSVHAYYRHSKNLHEIGIRESVYDKARNGDRTSLCSIAHEISHWGLINYFKFDFSADVINKLDPISRSIFIQIHENIADLLTSLLVFSEKELIKAHGAGGPDCSSGLSKNQISLASFYCQNHEFFLQNFLNQYAPKLAAQKQEAGRIEEWQKNKLPFNWR